MNPFTSGYLVADRSPIALSIEERRAWPGWYYVFQRTVAKMILSLRLIEKKLNG